MPIYFNNHNLKNRSVDIVLITGDIYVDQPSFGIALIARYLSKNGYSVGIISQPRDDKDFQKFGRPNLFFGITSGNLDTIVNLYTPNKTRRKEDDYSIDSDPKYRKKNAINFYTNKVKSFYKGSKIVLGGIEASLRRFSFYNYINDKIENSILFDSGADLIVYGMGELTILEIANRIKNSESLENIRGTVIKKSLKEYDEFLQNLDPELQVVDLETMEEINNDKEKFMEFFKKFYENQSPFQKEVLVQKYSKFYVVQNIPQRPMTKDEIDEVYEMDFTLQRDPNYKKGDLKSEKTAKFSIVTHRGCLGGCSFCAIHAHQGKVIQSRSEKSIFKEIERVKKHKDFKGVLQDVGGPSANMYGFSCKLMRNEIKCNRNCLAPTICKNLEIDLTKNVKLLRAIRKIKGIRKAFISSGIRFDLINKQKTTEYLEDILKYHISGQMKVAPEHVDNSILNLMQKPKHEDFLKFIHLFHKACQKISKQIYLIPYMIIAHPGANEKVDEKLKAFSKKFAKNFKQVQDFTPTPSTVSTAMYYTGVDFFKKGKRVFIQSSIIKRKASRKKFHK